MSKGMTRNIRRAIRRGHWITVVQLVLYGGLIAFILFGQSSLMEGLFDSFLPSIKQFPRW